MRPQQGPGGRALGVQRRGAAGGLSNLRVCLHRTCWVCREPPGSFSCRCITPSAASGTPGTRRSCPVSGSPLPAPPQGVLIPVLWGLSVPTGVPGRHPGSRGSWSGMQTRSCVQTCSGSSVRRGPRGVGAPTDLRAGPRAPARSLGWLGVGGPPAEEEQQFVFNEENTGHGGARNVRAPEGRAAGVRVPEGRWGGWGVGARGTGQGGCGCPRVLGLLQTRGLPQRKGRVRTPIGQISLGSFSRRRTFSNSQGPQSFVTVTETVSPRPTAPGPRPLLSGLR